MAPICACARSFALLVVAGVAASAIAQPVYIQRVAMAGDITPRGMLSTDLNEVCINQSGLIAFTGIINSRYSAILASPGSVNPLFVAGDTVQTSSGPVSTDFSRPVSAVRINDSGQVAFASNAMLIRAGSGAPTAYLRDGDPAGDGGIYSVTSDYFDDPYFRFNNLGQMLGRIHMVNSPDFIRPILISSPTQRTHLFAGGSPIGAPADGLSIVASTSPLVLTNTGHAGQVVSLTGPGVDSTNNVGLAVYNGSSNVLVARTGSVVPNSGGRTLRSIDQEYRTHADNGNIASAGYLNSLGGSDQVRSCVMTGTESGLSLLAKSGDPAPGLPANTTLNVFETPSINDAGKVAIVATLSNPNVLWGLWTVNPGSSILQPLAMYGEPAPGTNRVFQGSGVRATMNDQGQVLFHTNLSSNGSGIFATTLAGDLTKVVATGDMLETAPGVFRQVQSVTMSDEASASGLMARNTFNEQGMLAFVATFTDGSVGVFRAQVPAPGSCTIALATLVLAQRRRRHRS